MLRRALRALWRGLLLLAGIVVGAWALGVAAYRWIDPPLTPLMVMRWSGGQALSRWPVPLTAIDPDLPRAVIAAEDNRFCSHAGIDIAAVEEAIEDYRDGRRLRGASTITMQLARNLFLWPGGGAARKGAEVGIALALDLLWPKRRIMEVYLGIAEWGPGVFGAEAAARHHFDKPASRLDRHEASLLAAVLPSPREWRAARPSAFIQRRAGVIARRIDQLGSERFGCLLP